MKDIYEKQSVLSDRQIAKTQDALTLAAGDVHNSRRGSNAPPTTAAAAATGVYLPQRPPQQQQPIGAPPMTISLG